MYECNDCGEEFETPKQESANADGTGGPINICPECGSDDLIEFDPDEDYDDSVDDYIDDDSDLDLGDGA
jgi:DNA-directed RNA polymerase subunit RPC12/RpoP